MVHVWSIYLVGCLVAIFYFPINIGFRFSSQLTNSYFSEGWPWPTNQMVNVWFMNEDEVIVWSGSPYSDLLMIFRAKIFPEIH